MKVIAASAMALFALLSSGGLSTAKIIQGTSTKCHVSTMGKNHRWTYGAVYYMTNEMKGNYIISHDIFSNGKLMFSRGTYAGGRGARGGAMPGNEDIDPLFAQGAIQVSDKYLFVVNAGSGTLSMFKIDPKEPSKLTMVGNPVSTGGDFPVSVAVNPRTKNVCVLNGGEVNGVQCYKPDDKLGLITIANTRRTLSLRLATPPLNVKMTVSNLIFSPDGSKLIASIKGDGGGNKGFIAIWDVSGDHSLSASFVKTDTAKGGGMPSSLTMVGDKQALLNTDTSGGFSVYDYRNSKNGKPSGSTLTKVDGQRQLSRSAFSPKTGSYFLTDYETGVVTEVKIDPGNAKASIVNQYMQQGGSGPMDLAIGNIDGNDFAYILSPRIKSLQILDLSEGVGKAKNSSMFNWEVRARKAGMTVTPRQIAGMAIYMKDGQH